MRFKDLLSQPLPSTINKEKEYDEESPVLGSTTLEEDTDVSREPASAGIPDEAGKCVGGACQEDGDDDDDDDFNVDDLSDEDLAALDAELSDDDAELSDPEADGDDEEEVELTPEEEKEADDMMSIASTTALINHEMNAEERARFVESTADVQCAINEGLLMESDIDEIAAELGIVTEGKNYNKKMIIRLDKDAKMKQLYALGINVSAAAHNDPDYKKLKKVLRARKILKERLEKKYHAEGVKRMKIYYKRLVSSKSGILSALGKKLTGK